MQYNSYNRLSWNNVDGLFNFLTKVLHFSSSAWYGVIPRFHKDVSSSINNIYWIDFLNRAQIEPGDVVQYMVGSDWIHSALIVETDEPQTFYEPKPDQTDYPPDNCEEYLNKPRVVDRSGQIAYATSRSIDNTRDTLSGTRIIHIPNILPLSYWVNYVY